jgi:hypothetical protein
MVMICLLAYAIKAIADTLLLVSKPIGNLIGILTVFGSLIGIIYHMFKTIHIINFR